ncbi:hypothetical protein [Cognatishimia maritima]|nr:hypothetical protein [Cognatishimia maritima]
MADKKATPPVTDDALDALFAEAADFAPTPSDALMARVLADAEAFQPAAAEPMARRSQRSWRVFLDVIGGWQGAGGLVAATLAGVWIGFVGSDSVLLQDGQILLEGETDYYLSDLAGDFSFDIGEG